jgi:capsular exopolysaccharide synthesis family protein
VKKQQPTNSGVQTSPKIDEHFVTLFSRSSLAVQQYKALGYAIETMRAGDAVRVVAVTSPAVGEGKSTTAINLAGVSAHRREIRTLLVDADLRRPSVGSLLGIPHNQPGLLDAILDPHLTLQTVVTHMPAFNLWVLPAGRPSDDPYELLRTPRVKELLHEARSQYQLVVLDTAPLLVVPDTRILENLVDAFLLVVGAHQTPRKLVEEALNLLSPFKLGIVFNGDDRPLSGYYGYYHSYDNPSSWSGAPKGRAQRP